MSNELYEIVVDGIRDVRGRTVAIGEQLSFSQLAMSEFTLRRRLDVGWIKIVKPVEVPAKPEPEPVVEPEPEPEPVVAPPVGEIQAIDWNDGSAESFFNTTPAALSADPVTFWEDAEKDPNSKRNRLCPTCQTSHSTKDSLYNCCERKEEEE